MKINASKKSGFTLVEIMIVVAIIGLLAAIAIPNFVKARTQSQANACVNNLRQIDAAKQSWAMEKGATTSATPASTDLKPYLGHGTGAANMPKCPIGATAYTIGNLGTMPVCPNNTGSITNHVLSN